MLRFLTLRDGSNYIFQGNTGKVFLIHNAHIFRQLEEVYDYLRTEETSVDIDSFCRDVSTQIGQLDASMIMKLFFTEDIPPVTENKLLDRQYFDKAQKEYELYFLFPTYECNMRCKYCTYSGQYEKERTHLPIFMSFETGKKTIDFIKRTSEISNEVEIVFYGDESLLNFPIVKYIVDTLSGVSEKYKFQLVTNGLLLDEEIITYCIQKQIRLQLSIDGPKALHDRYRVTRDNKPTHEIVENKLTLIKNLNHEYYQTKVGLCCTLAPPFYLQEVEEYFKNHMLFSSFSGFEGNFSVSIMNMEGTDFYKNEDYFSFHEEMVKYEMLFIKALEDEDYDSIKFIPSAIYYHSFYDFVKRLFTASGPSKWIHPGRCIPAVAGVAIGADELLYVCNTYNRMPIGSLETGVDYNTAAFIYQKYVDLRNGKCSNCWFYRFCPVCNAAFKYVEEDEKYEDGFDCKYVLAKADSLLKMYITLGRKDPELLQRVIKNI